MSSTPMALRLDSSSVLDYLTRRTIAIGTAILLVVSVGGWLIFGSHSANKPVVPSISSSPNSFVSAPHTSNGAIIGATSFLLYYGSLLDPNSGADRAFLDSILDASSTQKLSGEITTALANGHKELAASKQSYVTMKPLGYKLTALATGDTDVSIWSVLVMGTGAKAQTFWTTSDVHLRWEQDQWRIRDWAVHSGPTAPNSAISTGGTANNGPSLLKVISGYQSYDAALSLDDASSPNQGK